MGLGEISDAFVDLNLFTLKTHLARVDPETRAQIEAAIASRDVTTGFQVLDADRRADYKAFTGVDMPADPAEAQAIWDVKDLENHETGLEGYLQVQGVRAALDAKNWDEAYRLARVWNPPD